MRSHKIQRGTADWGKKSDDHQLIRDAEKEEPEREVWKEWSESQEENKT